MSTAGEDGSGNESFVKLFIYRGQASSAIPRDITHVRVKPISKVMKLIKIFNIRLICNSAFCDCNQLTKVELCEGLIQIQGCAFKNCKALKYIEIPSTVKVIDYSAFCDCHQLMEVKLCDGLEQIGDSAFVGCRDLKKIMIPSTVKVIHNSAFRDCYQLTEVELCEGLAQIRDGAFVGCGSLKSIKIPSTVKVVDKSAFRDCNQLAEVELCEGLEQIGHRVFSGCKSLTHTRIPCTVKAIGNSAFRDCTQLVTMDAFEGLEQIKALAFNSCTSLIHIKIPSTVKVLNSRVFLNCQQLISVELGDEIEEIKHAAFQNCYKLRNIAIPRTAQHGSYSLDGCYDILQFFDSESMMIDALKSRFLGLPIHRLCYFQSYYSTEVVLDQLNGIIDSIHHQKGASSLNVCNSINSNQDCLGMTPLHILACSTKQNLDIYQCIVDNQSESLITTDRWGCLPILYALWCDAPQEIVQFLIYRQKSEFPNFDMNWDDMVENLCRAGAPLETLQVLFRTQKTFFPDNSINWQNAASKLTINCLVRCNSFRDFFSIWDRMLEVVMSSQMNPELIHSLLVIQQNAFQNQDHTNWKLVCEELFQPLKDWWQLGGRPNLQSFLQILQLLLRCSVLDRASSIGIREWRMNINDSVKMISTCSKGRMVEAYFNDMHSKLLIYEQKYHLLKDATFLLELTLWKIKIDESIMMQNVRQSNEMESHMAEMKAQCRMNCGVEIIIPNVLQFLIDMDKPKPPISLIVRLLV